MFVVKSTAYENSELGEETPPEGGISTFFRMSNKVFLKL